MVSQSSTDFNKQIQYQSGSLVGLFPSHGGGSKLPTSSLMGTQPYSFSSGSDPTANTTSSRSQTKPNKSAAIIGLCHKLFSFSSSGATGSAAANATASNPDVASAAAAYHSTTGASETSAATAAA